LEYLIPGEDGYQSSRDAPTMEELDAVKWPSTEKCLACLKTISAIESKCRACGVDQGRGALGEFDAGQELNW
jgi:hypothetical protein